MGVCMQTEAEASPTAPVEAKAGAITASATAGCFDKPIDLGKYLLLKEQGKGSFGVAYLAVLRRLFNKDALPHTPDIIAKATQLFVVKRFRTELDPLEIEQQGLTREEILASKRLSFIEERQQAAWLRGQISSHPNLVEYVLGKALFVVSEWSKLCGRLQGSGDGN